MNIFVAKLNYATQEGDLREAFENYGEVNSCKVVMDRDTGRSKGYGFVEMEDEDGRSAIEALNGAELDGNTIVVKESEPRPKRNNFSRGGGGGNFGRRY